MIKQDIVHHVVERTGLPRTKAEAAVDTVFEGLKQALAAGERIELRGFGVFSVRARKTGIGRNPRTGTEVNIAPGKAVRFKPGKELHSLTGRGGQRETACRRQPVAKSATIPRQFALADDSACMPLGRTARSFRDFRGCSSTCRFADLLTCRLCLATRASHQSQRIHIHNQIAARHAGSSACASMPRSAAFSALREAAFRIM